MAAAVTRPKISPEVLQWGRTIDRISNVALLACTAWSAWSLYRDDGVGVCGATAVAWTVGNGAHIIKVCVLGIPGTYVPDHL